MKRKVKVKKVKKDMTDQYRLDLLNKFANEHALAHEIKVIITDHHKSFAPRFDWRPAKYEDANLLASIITGAESFLFWCARNGYEVKKSV